MIKTAGANVSPREVEAAILEVSGLVAHVVGVADETEGQLVAALVRAPADGTVDVDDLRARLKERLSAYKVPKRFVVVAADEVPMMSSGKLDLRADRGAARCAEPTIPALLAERRAVRGRPARPRHGRRRRSPTPSSTSAARRSPPASSPPGW